MVLSHPVQYFSPWFRHVAARGGTELRVFYLWDFGVTDRRDRGFGTTFRWDIPLLDSYEWEFVPNASRDMGTHHFSGLTNPGLVSRLAEWRPDAILLFGYSYRSHLGVILSRRLRHVPLLFRGDSHDLARKASVTAAAGRAARRVLFRRFSAFLAVGEANRRYLLASGASAERIFHVPHCVDNARVREAVAADPFAGMSWRRAAGIPESATVLLFAGKLEPKKRPDLLLRAFFSLQNLAPNAARQAVMIFVGSGALEPELRAVAGERVGRDVFFVPFQNQTAMPAVYLAANVLVLPSASNSETWGLVVNEAMAMGRPAIVSNCVGCGPDLVKDGETGWVVERDNEHSLRSALAEAVSDPARLRRMGEAATQRIDRYSFDAATDGLERALDSVVPIEPVRVLDGDRLAGARQ